MQRLDDMPTVMAVNGRDIKASTRNKISILVLKMFPEAESVLWALVNSPTIVETVGEHTVSQYDNIVILYVPYPDDMPSTILLYDLRDDIYEALEVGGIEKAKILFYPVEDVENEVLLR